MHYVYIITNKRNGTLYVGVTRNDLEISNKFCKNFVFPIDSYLRTTKIYTLHSDLVVKTLGKLNNDFFKTAKQQVLANLEQ